MARHKRPWCRFCGKRKGRDLEWLTTNDGTQVKYWIEDGSFCSFRCAALLMQHAWDGEQEDRWGNWCSRCGRWSWFGDDWAGTQALRYSRMSEDMAPDPHLCKCPVPIPSWLAEPYEEEEHDDD